MAVKRNIIFICGIIAFCISSCARPLSWDVDTSGQGPYSYGPPANFSLQLSSSSSGDSAKHTLSFDNKKGDLETYLAVITYPSQFTYNGFFALGSAGTEVGSYSVDFDFDGVTDFTIPVYSIDNNTAYADRDLNGSFDAAIDSTMIYSSSGGNHVFTTICHSGATAPRRLLQALLQRESGRGYELRDSYQPGIRRDIHD